MLLFSRRVVFVSMFFLFVKIQLCSLRFSPRSTRLHWRFPRCRALGCSKCSRDNYISWGHLKRKERKFWMMGWWRAFFLLLKLCWLLMYTNWVFVSFLSFGFRKSCKKQGVHGQWITRICKRLWTMLAKWKGNPVLFGHCSIISLATQWTAVMGYHTQAVL